MKRNLAIYFVEINLFCRNLFSSYFSMGESCKGFRIGLFSDAVLLGLFCFPSYFNIHMGMVANIWWSKYSVPPARYTIPFISTLFTSFPFFSRTAFWQSFKDEILTQFLLCRCDSLTYHSCHNNNASHSFNLNCKCLHCLVMVYRYLCPF